MMMMMDSGSRSSGGDDEDDFARRLSSSSSLPPGNADLTIKVDGRSGEQKPGTPRSKHSATEQRRRCKINERFQILRDLIPHSDQKRDRATFLLEVIEYVRFLQEKLQKYETCSEWNQETEKLMPWSNNRVPAEGLSDIAHTTRNGNTTGYAFSDKFIDNSFPGAQTMLSSSQNVTESPDLNADITVPQPEDQWQRLSCPPDCTVSNDMANEQEELAIDEGTITLSSLYSQNLFTALTHAMESSGVDLSQASVTVQVNLGKRATCKRTSTSEDHDDAPPENETMGDHGRAKSGEEPEKAAKRQRANRS